jgi:hypothetical protein
MKNFKLFSFSFILSAWMISCGETSKKNNEDLSKTQKSLFDSSGEIANFTPQGDEKGNGGDAVVCFGDTQSRALFVTSFNDYLAGRDSRNPLDDGRFRYSVQLLDLYEYTLPVGLPAQSREPIKLEGDLMERFEKINARLALKSGLAEELAKNHQMIPLKSWRAADGVVEINDSYEAVVLKPDCLLMQVAVRQGSVVYYNRRLVEQMDTDNQFALYLHELVYKVASDFKIRNSIGARKVVGLLLSNESDWASQSPETLYEEFKVLNNEFEFPMKTSMGEMWIAKILERGSSSKLIKVKISLKEKPLFHLWKLIMPPVNGGRLDAVMELAALSGNVESISNVNLSNLNNEVVGKICTLRFETQNRVPRTISCSDGLDFSKGDELKVRASFISFQEGDANFFERIIADRFELNAGTLNLKYEQEVDVSFHPRSLVPASVVAEGVLSHRDETLGPLSVKEFRLSQNGALKKVYQAKQLFDQSLNFDGWKTSKGSFVNALAFEEITWDEDSQKLVEVLLSPPIGLGGYYDVGLECDNAVFRRLQRLRIIDGGRIQVNFFPGGAFKYRALVHEDYTKTFTVNHRCELVSSE